MKYLQNDQKFAEIRCMTNTNNGETNEQLKNKNVIFGVHNKK